MNPRVCATWSEEAIDPPTAEDAEEPEMDGTVAKRSMGAAATKIGSWATKGGSTESVWELRKEAAGEGVRER